MRRVLAGIIFGLLLVITAPAALAAEADYPPQAGKSGVVRRAPAAPTVESAVESQLGQGGGLARTGFDITDELAFAGGLIVLGGLVLLRRRRRGGAVRGRG
jgi:LPXTG-motif cell wall-anchored protein